MTKSRVIGRTRRDHFAWLQRALFGTSRWTANCRCGFVGPLRRSETRAWTDGAAHSRSLNVKRHDRSIRDLGGDAA